MLPCTRRDLLAAFLGLPVALAGCSRRAAAAARGRDRRRQRRAGPSPLAAAAGADAWEDVPVVIVGAGVAGLSAAWRLARDGFDHFVVLELEPAAAARRAAARRASCRTRGARTTCPRR